MEAARVAIPAVEPLEGVGPALEALARGDIAGAAALAAERAEADPGDVDAWELLSVACYRRGDLRPAVEAARRAVALTPMAAGRHANLGAMLRASGQAQAAEMAYRAALAADPAFAAAHQNLGNLYLEQGALEPAEASLREALRLNPAQAEAWRSLATVLQQAGRPAEALEASQALLALQPDDAQALSDAGAFLMALDRPEEARIALEKAIALRPDLVGAHANLGALHLRAGRLFAAMRATERALSLDPDEHRSVSNLAVVLKDMGRFAESEAMFRRALSLKPDYATGHANLLFCLNYHPDKSAEAVFEEYRRWDGAHAKGRRPAQAAHANDRDPARRLRVGFVSPDFREHSAGPYIEPLLAGLDRAAFEVFCYAEMVQADAATERFKALADGWRSTAGLSDEAVAKIIVEDRIDILIDLGGHTAASRLSVFALKPAPIQASHFLGHGYTSGLSAMDVFLCDAAMVPAGAEALFAEKTVLRLPRIPLAYAPPAGMPEPTPSPALARGHVTFGYFGRPERINERVVAAWAAILNGVPDARLTLNAKLFGEAACRELFEQRFAAHGVGAERLDLVYTHPQPNTWAAYAGIDIALDPFPHNAGATTIEALWLGVPVLSVKDRPSVGRFGAAILGALGLSDWVAEDVAAYVAKAVAAAGDPPALQHLRQGLRARFQASPLADAQDLGRQLGQALRSLWTQWVADARAAEPDEDAEALSLESDRLRIQGQLPQAEAAARRALEIDPTLASAANHLGNALVAQGRVQEADEAFDRALALKPDYAEAYNNRALSRMRRGLVCAAEQDLRAAMALRPDLPEMGFNLASALQDQGRVEEALAVYRAAAVACPRQPQGHGAMLFCLGYQPNLTPEAVFEEFRRWDERHARPHQPACLSWDNDPDPDRRLRIGYVSPDFSNRSARHFIEPMLAGHDRSVVEVYCYAETPHPDAVTARFQSLADHWRPTVGVSDDDVAEMIRRDKIDVLIDLGGHTARNRLLALARKPAPVQIAHFLGHGYTSGLSAMDVFLADEALAPAGSDHLFAETVARLDRIPIAYQPPEALPAVGPLPALRNGHVTFGHFGRVVRINDRVVETWAAILNAVPGSRLVLNTAPFYDEGVRRRYLDLFAAQGVEAGRLDLVFTHPQPNTWAAYGEIDIALDPFPHNAGTTTIEALWLGVPVVSLADRPSVGRFGACILRAAGLADWVAETPQAYVDRAVAAAADLPALAALRAGLRERMEASPLADGDGLARALEGAYRRLWRDWCGVPAAGAGALTQQAAAAFQAGDFAQAAALFERLAKAGDDAGHWSNLGACLRALGRVGEAEQAFRRAIALDPSLANAHANLGNLLVGRRRMQEAETAYLAALDLAPDNADVWRALAVCRLAHDRPGPAREAVERALSLVPDHAQALETLASLQRQEGEPMAALENYARARAGAPNDSRILGNMAVALQDLAMFDRAEAMFRRALSLKPDYATGHANLLFCLNYHPDKSAEAVFEEYRRWDGAHAKGRRPAQAAHANDRDPARRLRVGFVSPDFREHSAGPYIEPLLAGLDRAAFEVFCYAEMVQADAATERFKALADGWRSTAGLSDEAVAKIIVEDRIDILIDLGGHTAASRLSVFALKPAPIQASHFLGHGYTSGLSAMDVFLCDAAMVPAGAEALFAEKTVLRLPRIPLAYAPPAGMPEPTPSPALARGHVTFGYFGRPERINERVVAAWAAILNGVPDARLTLNAKLFGEAACRELFEQRFAAHGVGAERLDLVYTHPQPNTWAAYAGIDIALDPFPHNAGATTIEALWLGVPVLSVKDRPSVGRFGAAILGALGLSDWVAEDVAAYVAKAIAAAGDPPTLQHLRQGLRARFQASPLADAQDLGRQLGQALRSLWTQWVEDHQATEDIQRAAVEAFGAGDYAAAAAAAERGLGVRPQDIDLLHIRGLAAFRQGRLAEAAADVGHAVQQAPDRPELRWNLTAVLRAKGELQAAEAQGWAATLLAPQSAEAHNNLGLVYLDQGRGDHAEASFREAAALAPDQANGWSNLALALNLAGRGGEAEAAARRAIALNSADANAVNNLGTALMHQDRLAEAADAFRRACDLRPGFVMAHSNLLFCLNYDPSLAAETIFQEYRRWDVAHARPLAAGSEPFTNDRDPERRLRVGYVSPDFRHHAASFFVEPLLAAHDREQVELFCYAEVRNPDAVTERFKAMADHWRSTVGLSDDEVAALVRRDQIDVLVDLAGHTASNRLLVFARRAAPVQVGQIVGSGATTGLSEMDGFLIDAALAPPGAEALFSERLVRLGRIPLVYAPPEGMPPVGPSPARRNGHVTFGCFSRTARINDAVVDAWAAILRGVPDARLMLNAKPFQEQATREAFAARFAARGIEAGRLDLVFTSPQTRTWAAYGEIDIALDPFPHNAGTTTIEALWLGVPVVSLAARPPVGRFGRSILGALGLDDWAVDDVAGYVDKAVAAAADVAALADLRSSLRERFEQSPLRDAAGLARKVEEAYRVLWRLKMPAAEG